MRRRMLVAFLFTAVLLVALAPSFGAASASPKVSEDVRVVMKSDFLHDPLTDAQIELRATALQAKLHGKARGKTAEVARGQFVELARESEDAIWTVLGEFADQPHNTIAEPDRAVNNTTIWVPDFSRDYYMDVLFNDAPGANSMRNYYIEQSSDRYAVYGDVTDWVPVPQNMAYYNEDNPGGYANVWFFLEDSLKSWYDAQIAAGQTPAQIDAYLSQFDVRDRYDHDGDGNFDEPDGYIDTFQSVHSGEGEEAWGGPTTIFSHMGYARWDLIGTAGPAFNPLGGIQVGGADGSDYWVSVYTIEPENGGVGLFAHEYAHTLGVPDLYDYYADFDNGNGTEFWTLMSRGMWLSDSRNGIGSRPGHMSAWEKVLLGWLNYEVAFAGQKSQHMLGPMEFNTKQAQGLFVFLPDKQVLEEIGTPYAGSHFYYSGSGNGLFNYMVRPLSLAAGSTLSAKVNFEIELDYDYAYLIASTDGGATWSNVETNLSTTTSPNGQNPGYGITGTSGGWVDLTADLSAYTGDVLLAFAYWTDAAVAGAGFMVDEISVTGYPIDGAEADAGWTFAGFHVSTGTEPVPYANYYVVEYRTYRGYDSTLRVGPYHWGHWEDPELQYYFDYFAYQDGMLIWYWDTSQNDNNVALHPGHGMLLPVDAHYQALHRVDSGVWQNHVQTYDSTFTLTRTDGIPNIHYNGVLSPVPSLPAVKAFDDRILHYDPMNPLGSVIHPNTGTIISTRSINSLGNFMQIQVAPAN